MHVNPASAPRELHAYCDWLNALSWVRASGRPFLIRYNRDKEEDELVRTGEFSDMTIQ